MEYDDDLYGSHRHRSRDRRRRGAEIERAENGYIVHAAKRVKLDVPLMPPQMPEEERAVWERMTPEYRWVPATFIAATFDDAVRMLADHFGESAPAPPAH